MFEQCLPYKDLSLEKELTCDVLIDDDDLLSQLSSQLDIPSFVDQGKAKHSKKSEIYSKKNNKRGKIFGRKFIKIILQILQISTSTVPVG